MTAAEFSLYLGIVIIVSLLGLAYWVWTRDQDVRRHITSLEAMLQRQMTCCVGAGGGGGGGGNPIDYSADVCESHVAHPFHGGADYESDAEDDAYDGDGETDAKANTDTKAEDKSDVRIIQVPAAAAAAPVHQDRSVAQASSDVVEDILATINSLPPDAEVRASIYQASADTISAPLAQSEQADVLAQTEFEGELPGYSDGSAGIVGADADDGDVEPTAEQDLSLLSMEDLKAMAEERKVKGYRKMRKNELVAALSATS